MIGSLKPRKGCNVMSQIPAAGPSKASARSAAWRIGWDAPCVAGLPRLRLNWGSPVRPARRVHPLDVCHRALLVAVGSRKFHLAVVKRTLQAALRRVNSDDSVVRSARAQATVCHNLRRGMWLHISIDAPATRHSPACNTSKPVYLPRGILFDSKIKQLRERRGVAAAARC